MSEIKLEITTKGGIAMLHDDAVDLGEFGNIEVARASHVEFDNKRQEWFVMSAWDGAILGWYPTRALALKFEKEYYSPDGPGWDELKEVA